jgi:hypothetical protein
MSPNGGSRLIPLLCSLIFLSPVQGQWQETGPYGGSADFIRVNAKRLDMLLAGARQGLLFQSVNGGKSWSPLSYPGQLRGTLSTLEIDPRNPAIFFAGVKDDRHSPACIGQPIAAPPGRCC